MRKKLLFLGMIPLLLMSCGKSKNAITVFVNAELLVDSTAFIDTNEDRIIKMMDNKLSFILYQYSKTCSYCESVSENFSSFFMKNHPSIYRYEVSNSYRLLYKYDEKAFPELASTPRVMIFKEGKYIDEVNSSKIVQPRLFSSAVNSFISLNNNVYSVTSLKAYQNLISLYDDTSVLLFNSYTNEGMDEYLKLYNDSSVKDIHIVIDKEYADQDLIEYIKSE